MQRSVRTPSFLSGKLAVGLVGVKGDILPHENSVHDFRVNPEQIEETRFPQAVRAD